MLMRRWVESSGNAPDRSACKAKQQPSASDPKAGRQRIERCPSVLEAETVAQYGVEVIGRSNELEEQLFAISVERHITHPCLLAITDAARGQLFRGFTASTTSARRQPAGTAA